MPKKINFAKNKIKYNGENKMIKKILIIAVLSVTGITQAAYEIIIPLEQSQGGLLPSGSIKMIETQSPTIPDIDLSLECPSWESRKNDWMSLPQYNQDVIYYKGLSLFIPQADLYQNGGFIYKKGKLKQIEEDLTEHYEICRKSI